MEGWQLGLTLLMAFTARVAASYAALRGFVFCWTVWNSKIRSFSDITPEKGASAPGFQDATHGLSCSQWSKEGLTVLGAVNLGI